MYEKTLLLTDSGIKGLSQLPFQKCNQRKNIDKYNPVKKRSRIILETIRNIYFTQVISMKLTWRYWTEENTAVLSTARDLLLFWETVTVQNRINGLVSNLQRKYI